MYIIQESGDLALNTIATGTWDGTELGDGYTAFISDPGGSILNGVASGANITSGMTYLFAQGSIGSSSNYITSATPGGTAPAQVQGLATTGGIFLSNTGGLAIDAFTGSGDSMNAGGSIDVLSNCPITVTGVILAQGSITYANSYDAGQGNSITISGGSSLTATNGAITIDSVAQVSITGSTLITTGGGIQITAGSYNLMGGTGVTGDTSIIGSILEATGGGIQVTAGSTLYTGNTTITSSILETTKGGNIQITGFGSVIIDSKNGSSGAVSYTHLDVYKRQTRRRPGAPRSCRTVLM